MKSTLIRLLPILAICWLPVRADTISYSDSGTFSASTPSDALAFSGPSETWAFHFDEDSHPTVLEHGNGGFDFAFSDFSYSLNGSPVAITPTFIRFFSPGNGGGFEICFNGTTVQNCTDGFVTPFFLAPMYTGTTAAPTLLTGAFTFDVGVNVNGAGFDEGTTTVEATPEPSTWLMLSASVVALVGRRLYLRT